MLGVGENRSLGGGEGFFISFLTLLAHTQTTHQCIAGFHTEGGGGLEYSPPARFPPPPPQDFEIQYDIIIIIIYTIDIVQ